MENGNLGDRYPGWKKRPLAPPGPTLPRLTPTSSILQVGRWRPKLAERSSASHGAGCRAGSLPNVEPFAVSRG